MHIKWHCRTCNHQSEDDISWELITKTKAKFGLIEIVIAIIEGKHKEICNNPDIGVRTT